MAELADARTGGISGFESRPQPSLKNISPRQGLAGHGRARQGMARQGQF